MQGKTAAAETDIWSTQLGQQSCLRGRPSCRGLMSATQTDHEHHVADCDRIAWRCLAVESFSGHTTAEAEVLIVASSSHVHGSETHFAHSKNAAHQPFFFFMHTFSIWCSQCVLFSHFKCLCSHGGFIPTKWKFFVCAGKFCPFSSRPPRDCFIWCTWLRTGKFCPFPFRHPRDCCTFYMTQFVCWENLSFFFQASQRLLYGVHDSERQLKSLVAQWIINQREIHLFRRVS